MHKVKILLESKNNKHIQKKQEKATLRSPFS